MKALILAAGRGSRLNELSDSTNKCLLKINGKSLIEYNLDNITKLEIDEIIIVVGYYAEHIINRIGISYNNKRIKYVLQHQQKGLVHAIECAEKSIGGSDFLISLGDEILINPMHKHMIEMFYNNDSFGVCGVLKVDDINNIKKTYSILLNGDVIQRLIEKPLKPHNNIMGTGNCIFSNEIYNYIKMTPINQQRKQKELPDLIQCAIDDGNIVRSFEICDDYVNINENDDLVNAVKYL
jgi:dTDP-glucose pyrophosphorylase